VPAGGGQSTDLAASFPKWWQERLAAPSQLFAMCSQAAASGSEPVPKSTLATASIGQALAVSAGHCPSPGDLRHCTTGIATLLECENGTLPSDADVDAATDLLSTLNRASTDVAYFYTLQSAVLAQVLVHVPSLLSASSRSACSRFLHTVADTMLAPHEEPTIAPRVSKLSVAPAAGSSSSAASSVLRGVAANMSRFFASLQPAAQAAASTTAIDNDIQVVVALPSLSSAWRATAGSLQQSSRSVAPAEVADAAAAAITEFEPTNDSEHCLKARLARCAACAISSSSQCLGSLVQPAEAPLSWYRDVLSGHMCFAMRNGGQSANLMPVCISVDTLLRVQALSRTCLHLLVRCLVADVDTAVGYAARFTQILTEPPTKVTQDWLLLWELCCQLVSQPQRMALVERLMTAPSPAADLLLLALAPHLQAGTDATQGVLQNAVALCVESDTQLSHSAHLAVAVALLSRWPSTAESLAQWTQVQHSRAWEGILDSFQCGMQQAGAWPLLRCLLTDLTACLVRQPHHAPGQHCLQQLLAAVSKGCLVDNSVVSHLLALLLPRQACTGPPLLSGPLDGASLAWQPPVGGMQDWTSPAAWMLRCYIVSSPIVPSVLHVMSGAGEDSPACCALLQYLFAQHPGTSQALKAQHGWEMCSDMCAAVGKVDSGAAAALLLCLSMSVRSGSKQRCTWGLISAAARNGHVLVSTAAAPKRVSIICLDQLTGNLDKASSAIFPLSTGTEPGATNQWLAPGVARTESQISMRPMTNFVVIPGMGGFPVLAALRLSGSSRIAVLQRLTQVAQESAACAEALCTQPNLHALLHALPNIGTESLQYATYLLVALLEYRCSPRDVALLLMLTLLPTAAITALRIETKANRRAVAARAARVRAEREAAALSAMSDQDTLPSHHASDASTADSESLRTVAAREELQLQLLFVLGRLLECVQPPALYTWLEQCDGAAHMTPLLTDPAPLPASTITLCMWCRPVVKSTAAAGMRICTVSLGDVQLLLDMVPVDPGKVLFSARASLFAKHEGTWHKCASKVFSASPWKLQSSWRHLGVSAGVVQSARGVSLELVHWMDGRRQESCSQLLASPQLDTTAMMLAFARPAERGPVTALLGSAGAAPGLVGGLASAACISGPPTPACIQELMQWPTKAAVTAHSELDALEAVCAAHGQVPLAALLDGAAASRSTSGTSGREQAPEASPSALYVAFASQLRDTTGQHTRCSLVDSLLRGIKLGEERVGSILQGSGHSAQDAGTGNLGLVTCLLPTMAASSRTQSASLRLIAQMLAVDSAQAATSQFSSVSDQHLLYHWWDSNAGFAALEYLLLSQLQRGRSKFAAYQNSIVEAASSMNPDDVSPFSSAQPSALPHKQVLSVLWNKEVFTELFNMMKAGDQCVAGPEPSARGGGAAGSGAASSSSSATGSLSTNSKPRKQRSSHKSSGRSLHLISGCALQSIIGLLPFCDACTITGMSTLVQSSAAFEQPVLSIVSGMEDVQAQVADSIAEALTEDKHSIEAWFAASCTPHPLPNGTDAMPGLTEAHARNNEDGPGIGRLLDMIRLSYPHLLPPSPLSDASLVPTEEISLLSRGNRRMRTPLLVALRKVLLRKQLQSTGAHAYATVSQGELQVLFDYICSGCSVPTTGGSPAAAGELAALTDIVNCVLVALMSPGGEVLLARMKLLSQGLWTIPMMLMDCAVPSVRCSGLRLLSILLQRPGLSKEADAFIIAGGVEGVAAVLAKWSISTDIVQTLIGVVAGFFRVGVVPEGLRPGAPGLSRERSSGSLGNASDHASRRYNSWHHGSELHFAQPYFLSCLLMLLSVCRDHDIVLRSLSDLERAVSVGRTPDAAGNVSVWLATHSWFRQLASFEASWRDGGLSSNSWLNRLGPAVMEGSNMAAEAPTKLPGPATADSGSFRPMLGTFSPPAAHDEGSTVSSSLLEGDVVRPPTPNDDAHSPDFAAMRSRTYSREHLESHGGGSRVSHPSLKAGSADGSDGGRAHAASATFDRAHSVDFQEPSGAVSVDGSLSHDAFGSGSASDTIVQRVHSILRQLLLFDLQHRSSETTPNPRGASFRDTAAIVDAFGAGAGWHDVIKCVDNPGFQIAALRDILQGLQAEPEIRGDTSALFGRNFSKLIRSSVSLLGQSLPPALHVHMVGVINLISMRNTPEVRQKLSLSGLMAARDLVTVSLLQRCGHDLDVVAEAVAALEPAFESVSMTCAPAVKECGGVYRLLHLVLIAACAAEMDLAAVLLRICGQLTRSSDDAARAVSKCTEHPYLLAQLFRGMEVPASVLGAGGSWMSMTSWRYGSTAAAAAALMHSADDPTKAAAAAGGGDLVQNTDDFLQWLRPLLLGSNTDGALVAAATVFASRVQDGFKAAAGATEKTESKLQLSRGKAIRARIDKVTQQRRKTTAQVHAIAKQLTTEVLASRRRETFRVAHRESQRRVRLTQGRHLWKGSKAIVSRMLQNEVILGVDLQGGDTGKAGAVVPVRASMSSSARSSTVLSGSEMELDAATRSLPGLRRVKVARVRTGTKSSVTSLHTSSTTLDSGDMEDSIAFDFEVSWGKFVDVLLQ